VAISIVATPNDPAANSFITEAEFIAYLATRLNVPAGSTVSGSTCTETEKKAMIEATRELNDLEWIGYRHSTTQALAWGRDWAENPDAENLATTDISIQYFASDAIPQRVKDATCELAMQFVKAGTTDIAATDDSLALTGIVAGSVELDFADPSIRVQGLSRYPRILNRLRDLLASGSGQMEVVRA